MSDGKAEARAGNVLVKPKPALAETVNEGRRRSWAIVLDDNRNAVPSLRRDGDGRVRPFARIIEKVANKFGQIVFPHRSGDVFRDFNAPLQSLALGVRPSGPNKLRNNRPGRVS